MNKLLKKDSFILGISLGVLIPAMMFGVLFGGFSAIFSVKHAETLTRTLALVAIFLNMFALRHYLLREKFDKTGRGILLATFVLAMLYFIFFYNSKF
jgi:flagellar biosynthesis protein FliQ